MLRSFYFVAGILSLSLGVVGIFLPFLPTVPFILLAAFCFARSSERFHVWLMNHQRFGPMIADWQERGAISPRAKRLATLSIVVALMIPIVLGLPLYALLLQMSVLLCVLIFIWTRPD